MKIPVVQKLLAGARQARFVMASHQAGKRLLPVDSKPLEFLQKLPV